MAIHGAARQCPHCKLGIPKYPGRYPGTCPRCKQSMTLDERFITADELRARGRQLMDNLPVLESRAHNLQQLFMAEGVLESAAPFARDKACSKARVIPFRLIEDVEAFKVWLEGPTDDGIFYRVESIEDPIMCFEFLEDRCRAFATREPTRYLGFDPREEMVNEDHDATFLGESLNEAADAGMAGDFLRDQGWRQGRDFTIERNTVFVPDKGDVAEIETLLNSASAEDYGVTGLWYRKFAGARRIHVRESLNEDQTLRSVTYGPEMVAQRRRALDRKHDRVAGAFAEDMRASVYRQRKPGEGRTQVRGPFRIHVGHNKNRKPRKDVEMSLQNKMNAKRGLRGRIQGAKKWHRSRKGQDLHKALARYNRGRADEHDAALRSKIVDTLDRIKRYSAGQQRQIGTIVVEDMGTTGAATVGGSIPKGSPSQINQPTTEDHLEGILRKLIVSNDMDVLQDVHFDERDGSMYLFFDPILMHDEIQEILQAVRRESNAIDLIASPDGSLPGESVESMWWVLYAPGPMGGEPAPDVYAAEPDQHYTKAQMVTKAPPSPPEALAQGIDINKLIKAAGEKR